MKPEMKKARQEILKAVNSNMKNKSISYYMRHIQGAVFVARQRRLVSDDTLVKAGFNAVRHH